MKKIIIKVAESILFCAVVFVMAIAAIATMAGEGNQSIFDVL